MASYFDSINDPMSVVTAIDCGLTFPDSLTVLNDKYEDAIRVFQRLIAESISSADLLTKIRSPGTNSQTRMSLLKMFRRCVSTVCDTEATKKIRAISTGSLVENYGHTFKPISMLREDMLNLSDDQVTTLAALIGEYDTRGQSGYQLTNMFFDWFEDAFRNRLHIDGPRGAGRDIELSELFPDFEGSYPCDFVIRSVNDRRPLCVGFARYDSTRGGAQSDDRTGGNANKVDKARRYAAGSGNFFKVLFLSDGPGLTHGDTWRESCVLDGSWDGRVRVTTIKIAPDRVTFDWINPDNL